MKKRIFLFASLFLWSLQTIPNTNINTEYSVLSGYVKDASTGEELIGATVYIKELKLGTITNLYGFFSIQVPKSNYHLRISYVGYQTQELELDLTSSVKSNFELTPTSLQVKEVIVSAERKDKNITRTQMSVQKIEVATLKQLPSILGETDVMKSMTLLPGVQDGGEGSSGIYVRGGSADQNLVLLDEAPIYNASHLMGFFSVFNPDAIKSMEVYKGGIPASQGGRLSSLVDIRMKEGNSREFHGAGSLGLISSKLSLEGPILKDKISFLIAARRTYIDLFFPLSEETKDAQLHFYDLNAKLNWRIDDNDRLFLSMYTGDDVAGNKDLATFNWGNTTTSLRWNHLFSDQLFLNSTFIYSKYKYHLDIDASDAISYKWDAGVRDIHLKLDFDYYLNPTNTLRFGMSALHHNFIPGKISAGGSNSMFNDNEVAEKNAFETAMYLSNEQKLAENLTFRYGLRFSNFSQIGKGTEYTYSDPTNPSEKNISDTSTYSSFENIKTYFGLEPRFSANYILNQENSIKFSYNRTYQYIHLLTNTNSPTPLDVWTPSSKYIEPQIADQWVAGYFRNLNNNIYEASVEIYYKNMQNQFDFKDHAELLLNEHIETEIKSGNAFSYGVELMLKKNIGDLTGWVNYTYSKTRRKIPGINSGKEYSPPYDRTHDFKIVANYQLTDKWSFGGTWKYSTGMALTLPVAKYKNEGKTYFVFEEGGRGKYRAPAFHRLDVSVNYTSEPQKKEGWRSSWNFSVVNLYMRKNAYSIYFQEDEKNPNKAKAYQMSILGTLLPSVTYNVKF